MTIEASSSSSLILQAAAAAAGGQQYPAGALYVVATPIGNLADITLRALHVLQLVDAIACEDTRHTAALLRHYGIERPLLAVHQHNEREAAAGVIARLQAGERVAYVSDAGTPAISDPGARLVAEVRAAGLRAVPVPGASSASAALSVAGDVREGSYTFVGFLPGKARELAASLQALARQPEAQVLFEAPHRIETLARALAEACPGRTVTVGRELTKQFEEVATITARELPGWLAADANRRRGEFVLVLHAIAPGEEDDTLSRSDAILAALCTALPVRQAVALVAEFTGAPRNALYERALALRRAAGDDQA